MTVVFATERFQDFQPELALLVPDHWREIALNHNEIPLDPDWDRYNVLSDSGSLHCVTLRDEGILVGYHLAIITGMLHYKTTLNGITDVYYIKPDYRKGFTAVRMFRYVEAELRKRGCKQLITATKKHLDISAILVRLGFKPVETVFRKVLR